MSLLPPPNQAASAISSAFVLSIAAGVVSPVYERVSPPPPPPPPHVERKSTASNPKATAHARFISFFSFSPEKNPRGIAPPGACVAGFSARLFLEPVVQAGVEREDVVGILRQVRDTGGAIVLPVGERREGAVEAQIDPLHELVVHFRVDLDRLVLLHRGSYGVLRIGQVAEPDLPAQLIAELLAVAGGEGHDPAALVLDVIRQRRRVV